MKYLTFGSEKDKLRMVVDNGVDVTDDRVMTRTNEAIQLILGAADPQTHEPVIPVNGMMTADVAVVDFFMLLPSEMESVHYMRVLGTDVMKNDQGVRQGFYDIVNPFTYLDPTYAHDNPLQDFFMVTDPDDPAGLRRKYYYPGLETGTVRVVGPRSYQAITADADHLGVQNVPAIKRMIQSIEYTENNQGDEGQKYYLESIGIIMAEVKKHLMDPRWAMKRKGDYEADLVTFPIGSKGWVRARIALEVPGAMSVGREDLGRMIDRAQLRMMEAGLFKGCIEEFDATIYDGYVWFPTRVESVLAIDLDGQQIPIRSIFFRYLENGPGFEGTSGMLIDQGEEYFESGKLRRRKYRIMGPYSNGSTLYAVCKLRWEPKNEGDQLTITNVEANRVMVSALLLEDQLKWNEGQTSALVVLGKEGILQKELGEYLAGIKHTMPFAVTGGLSNADLGDYL